MGYPVGRERFSADAWQLEPPEVQSLLKKIKSNGRPLAQVVGSKPLRGILTGFNQALLIDTTTRNRLIAQDPGCEPHVKPYLRGQDVERWHANWDGPLDARHQVQQ